MRKAVVRITGMYLNTLAVVAPKQLKQTGYRLFCNPFSRPVKPHQQAFLETAESFTFHSAGLRIQGYKWGTGSKNALLIHGWASNTFHWRKLVPLFDPEAYTIYAFDAPAHGHSEGKLLQVEIYNRCFQDFREQVAPVDYAVAHSIGAFALQYALYRNNLPELRRAVLMAAAGEASDFFDYFRTYLRLSPKTLRLLTEKFEEELGNPPAYYSTLSFAKNISIPLLLIHDKEDRDTSPLQTEKLATILPDARLILTEGLGHQLKSDALNEQVVRWLEEG